MKWLLRTNSEIKIVDNILDIKPFEETVIIGTLFKEQSKKPSILNNIMGVLGAKKFYKDNQFNYGAYVTEEAETCDVAVLEDISGRITIKNSAKFTISNFVSGSILALKGKAIAGGYFEVDEFCFAGMPFRNSPNGVKIPNKKRELYDDTLLNSDR